MKKALKLAINHSDQPKLWSARWIEYCRGNGINCEIVDGYSTDIVRQLRGFDGLLWHVDQDNWRDMIVGRMVLLAAERMGLGVFPDFSTCCHFDDKLFQKYILEAADIPLIPTYAFFHEERALEWLRTASYPLVGKLRRGAASYNVRLLANRSQAEAYCRRMFSNGFSSVVSVRRVALDTGKKIHRQGKSYLQVIRGKMERVLPRLRENRLRRLYTAPERGYVYFQDFIPNNCYDTRVSVIGNRVWAFIRHNRVNDFRASGSGAIDYKMDRIDKECLKIACQTSHALNAQSIGVDFLRDAKGRPLVAEVSYGFVSDCIYDCPGHWDRDLVWWPGQIRPEVAVIEDLVSRIEARRGRTVSNG